MASWIALRERRSSRVRGREWMIEAGSVNLLTLLLCRLRWFSVIRREQCLVGRAGDRTSCAHRILTRARRARFT